MMLEHQLTIKHRVSANGSYDRYIGVHGFMPEMEGGVDRGLPRHSKRFHRAREGLAKVGEHGVRER
ncbi:hypothetical protein D3C81_998400 [compost metagenome]|jgi:hypothetical protein